MPRIESDSCAPCLNAHPREKGFMLLTYVASLAMGAVLAALVCTGLGRTALSWQRLHE